MGSWSWSSTIAVRIIHCFHLHEEVVRMRRTVARAIAVSLALVPLGIPLATTQAVAQDVDPPALAESVKTQRYMIVTANPLATAAGRRILSRGGTATDAMIAAQSVLGLVEPQSSGIGGGAFVVYYDAFNDKLTTFDARETAPAAATGDRFLDDEGNCWWTLFQDARKLARRGFPLTQRTSDQVDNLLSFNTRFGLGEKCSGTFFRDPAAFDYFVERFTNDEGVEDCRAKAPGTIIKNRDYNDTLKALVKGRSDAFYTGEIAEAIVAAVNSDPGVAGDMTPEDLQSYEVIEREPVCIDYRGYPVCGMGPPSSGALAVGQILGIMENFDVGFEDPLLGDLSDPLTLDTVHLFTQAGRLAFADRGQFVGDSDFVSVPVEGMLDKRYLKERSMLINRFQDIGTASAGNPPGSGEPVAADARTKDSGTSHISIVDRYGNALSMTTTIESSLGNGVLVKGFFLNNELTDFSFSPGTVEEPIANRVQPGKRPRSSMSPTIVFDGVSNRFQRRLAYKPGRGLWWNYFRPERGAVELVTGSPGGSRIIGYTAQSIMNHIDFGLDPQASINLPHYMNRNGTTDIEEPLPGITVDYDAVALQQGLLERGHSNGGSDPETAQVGIIAQTSGLSIINVTGRELIGGADKRRDGTVEGR